jgi:hypothetical protein
MSKQQGNVGAATAAFSRGDVNACIEIAMRGISDASAKGSEAEAWWFHCLLARCLGLQGRFQEAFKWYESATQFSFVRTCLSTLRKCGVNWAVAITDSVRTKRRSSVLLKL